MAHETSSSAKCGAKHFRVFDYRIGILKKNGYSFLQSSGKVFSGKDISNLYYNMFLLSMNIMKNIKFRFADRNRKQIEK
jgi:hypothetical protein